MSTCVTHGPHEGLICLPCYAIQQERVERESAPLRYVNTATALRRRVLEQLAERNGASQVQPSVEDGGEPREERGD